MAAVNQLCGRCLLLRDGTLAFDGGSKECIDLYMRENDSGVGSSDLDTASLHPRAGTGAARITRVSIRDDGGRGGVSIGIGDPVRILLHVEFHARMSNVVLGAEVVSSTGVPLLNLRTDSQGLDFGPYEAGSSAIFTIRVPGLPFYPGLYRVEPWVAEKGGRRVDQIRDGVRIAIDSRGRFRSEKLLQPERGLVVMDCDWSDKVDPIIEMHGCN
jgi:hypothetical protein